MKGKFITFEGGEGVGKTTQLRMIREYLDQKGVDAVFLREPGGNAISEKIRAVILDRANDAMTGMCEAMLYSAARAQLCEEVIRPALEEGKLVVCDRFIDSTFAYQGVARGLGSEKIDTLNKLACSDIMPDLTVFLDLEPTLAFERKGGADADDRLEQEGMDFHIKVYEGYKLACQIHGDRIVDIDCSSEAEVTHRKIVDALIQRGILDR
ncbi:MAG: dTMP kinase [Clostridia bacterium]|nr:dTMP kinase [Clostridia bacterium]MDE6758707.1 dTMP kinase [Clostridia bacterium]MDE7079273.1 dTMP kinase [Clostridia bacterium]